MTILERPRQKAGNTLSTRTGTTLRNYVMDTQVHGALHVCCTQQCKSREANTVSCPIMLTVQKGTALWRRQNRMPLHNCCNSCHLSMDKAYTALLCLSTSSSLMSSEGRKAPLFPFYRAGKAETMGPADRHKPQAVWQVFSEVPASSHLTLEAPKYQFSRPPQHLEGIFCAARTVCLDKVGNLSKHLSIRFKRTRRQETRHQWREASADCMPFLISVIVLTTLLSHRASSCSVSQAQRVLIIPGIAEEFQEKEVTLCLTGLWADYENAPQGSRKVGLESPFCPGDVNMMSHRSAPQHQRPSALWPSNDFITCIYRNKTTACRSPRSYNGIFNRPASCSQEMSELVGTEWQPGRQCFF